MGSAETTLIVTDALYAMASTGAGLGSIPACAGEPYHDVTYHDWASEAFCLSRARHGVP